MNEKIIVKEASWCVQWLLVNLKKKNYNLSSCKATNVTKKTLLLFILIFTELISKVCIVNNSLLLQVDKGWVNVSFDDWTLIYWNVIFNYLNPSSRLKSIAILKVQRQESGEQKVRHLKHSSREADFTGGDGVKYRSS